jgi:hypothetical protein
VDFARQRDPRRARARMPNRERTKLQHKGRGGAQGGSSLPVARPPYRKVESGPRDQSAKCQSARAPVTGPRPQTRRAAPARRVRSWRRRTRRASSRRPSGWKATLAASPAPPRARSTTSPPRVARATSTSR